MAITFCWVHSLSSCATVAILYLWLLNNLGNQMKVTFTRNCVLFAFIERHFCRECPLMYISMEKISSYFAFILRSISKWLLFRSPSHQSFNLDFLRPYLASQRITNVHESLPKICVSGHLFFLTKWKSYILLKVLKFSFQHFFSKPILHVAVFQQPSASRWYQLQIQTQLQTDLHFFSLLFIVIMDTPWGHTSVVREMRKNSRGRYYGSLCHLFMEFICIF